MLFGNHGQARMLTHERHSRLLLAWGPQSKAAEPIVAAMVRMLSPLPPELRRSLPPQSKRTTIRHGNAWTTGRLLKYSPPRCT